MDQPFTKITHPLRSRSVHSGGPQVRAAVTIVDVPAPSAVRAPRHLAAQELPARVTGIQRRYLRHTRYPTGIYRFKGQTRQSDENFTSQVSSNCYKISRDWSRDLRTGGFVLTSNQDYLKQNHSIRICTATATEYQCCLVLLMIHEERTCLICSLRRHATNEHNQSQNLT